MRNFNQGGGSRFGASNGNRGGGARFGSDRGPVTMHRAVCSKCGRDCEVPFRPTGDKPIYCNDCFGANRGGSGDRFPRRDFDSRSSSRPSFSSNRTSTDFGRGSSPVNDEVKKQLEFLGLKIDRLTKIVENLSTSKFSSAKDGKESKEKSAQVKEALKDIAVSEKTKDKSPAKKKAVKKIKV